MPVEIEGAIPFEQDRVHASYDAAAAKTFWRQLVQADRVFNIFRARFLGKVSPVHFFWGSFDLAVTRFSGRAAPPLKSNNTPNVAAWVMNEAYSHECSSVGFWPGNGGYGQRGVLRLCVSGAGGLRRAARAPAGRGLQRGCRAVSARLRRGARGRVAGRRAARLHAEHLRGGGEPGELGSQGAGARDA